MKKSRKLLTLFLSMSMLVSTMGMEVSASESVNTYVPAVTEEVVQVALDMVDEEAQLVDSTLIGNTASTNLAISPMSLDIATMSADSDSNVASITKDDTTTYYETLADALQDVDEDDTLKLLQDIPDCGELMITTSFTLDLNGYAITNTSATNAAITVNNSDAEVTIQNGTITTNQIHRTIYIYAAKNVVLEDLTIQNKYAVTSGSSTSVGYAVYAYHTGALTMTECETYSYGSSVYAAISVTALTVEDCDITSALLTGLYLNSSNAPTVIDNSTLTARSVGFSVSGNPSASIEVTDCTISSSTASGIQILSADASVTLSDTESTGAICGVVFDATEETVTITDCDLTGLYALFFQNTTTCDAIISGCTITNNSSSQSYGILCYNSGHTTLTNTEVTVDGESQGISVMYGTMEIGNGTVVNSEDTGLYVYNSPAVSIEDGAEIYGACAVLIYGINDADTLTKLTVNGGKIGNDNAIYAISGNGLRDSTDITITGGTIASGIVAVYHPQIGDLTMTGGTITAPSGIQFSSSGNFVMTGGRITATEDALDALYKSPLDSDGALAECGAAIAFLSRGSGYQSNTSEMTATIGGDAILESINNWPVLICRVSQGSDSEWYFNDESGIEINYLNPLTITGGTFIGPKEFNVDPQAIADNIISISGGLYEVAPSSDFIDTGYYVSQTTNDDDYYYIYAQATVTDDTGEVVFAGFLVDAIAAAHDGDSIMVATDVELTSALLVNSNITIMGVTGDETISASYDTSENNGLFVVGNDVTATFKNLTFTVDNFGITNEALANTATITVDGCSFYADGSANSVVSGDYALDQDNHYSLTFTNNVVNGDFAQPLHIILLENDTLVVDNNQFTGVTADESTCSLTIVVQDDSATVSITNNTFDTLYKAIGVDNSTATGTWTITGNRFLNCVYDFELSTTNSYNTGYSLAYNYFEGTLPVILDSTYNSIYSNADNANALTYYPYYSDVTLTTLVYADGATQDVTAVAIEALENLDTSNADAIAMAAYLVASADAADLADAGMTQAINELDALFAEMNEANLDVNATIDANAFDDEDQISVVDVYGLALAVYGNGTYIAQDTTLTLEVEQIEVDDDDVDFAFTAQPWVKINGYEQTKVDNGDLHAPVTFVVYVPESFEGDYATVVHENSAGETVDIYTLPVLTDAVGNRYLQVTVTEFSTFHVTGFTATSSSGSSSRTTYYDITVEDVDNGEVSVSATRAAQGKTVTITVTPDDGYETDEVLVLDEDDDEIDVTDKGDGKYSFTMPDEDVTIAITFVAIEEIEDEVITRFVDVDADAYYYDAVLWAVENGITNGMTELLFAPDTVCTRAQAVTFLWNAAGQPTVSVANPFTDVSEDAWYYQAVLWAVSEGITNGMTDTTFAPNATCTRAQIITFLWNAAGNPVVNSSVDFDDVADDSWYAQAVRWAINTDITAGMSTTQFAPSTNCTRGQIVTFLYRYSGE